MRRTPTPVDADTTGHWEFRYGRGARWGLLLLLTVTVFFAAGALFTKYKLESFRATVMDRLEARMGARLIMGAVSVDGFRGLRIDDLRVALAPADGPAMSLETPVAYVRINLNDLLYGRVTVDRIVLDHSRILVERHEGSYWYSPSGFDPYEAFALKSSDTFRLTGSDCTLEIRNVVGDTRLNIEPFRFDVFRPVDAADMTASLDGTLAGDPDKGLSVRLTFSSLEDFDLRVQASKVTAEDANVFLPAEHQLLQSGTATPTFWLNGRPDKTLLLWLQTPFEDIVIRDQPKFLKPASGNLTFDATYTADEHRLVVTAAKAESEQLSGVLEGTVSLEGMYPEFDLRLKTQRLPITEFLHYAIDGQLSEYGDMEFIINEPHELVILLQGTSDAPRFQGQVTAGSGELRFLPKNEELSEISMSLGSLEGTWDSGSQRVSGSFTLVEGEIQLAEHGPSTAPNTSRAPPRPPGPSAGEVVSRMGPGRAPPRGANRVPAGRGVRGAPVRVLQSDSPRPFKGEFVYDLATGDGEMSLDGVLAEVESTLFAALLPRTTISGTMDLHCNVTKRENHYLIDASIDATLARIAYDWWFDKSPGIGANGKVRVSLFPYRSAVVEVDAEMASSHFKASATLGYKKDRPDPWRVQVAQAASERLDINALGKCLALPYRVTGGIVTEADFRWKAQPGGAAGQSQPGSVAGWRQTLSCKADEVVLLPLDEEAEIPMQFAGLDLEVTVQGGSTPTGSIVFHARSASMPPFGAPWFIALRPPDIPPSDRAWSYTLSADALELPPWIGSNFTGKAYTNPLTAGFNEYGADVDGGHIGGNYHLTKAEHAYIAEIIWDDVPAKYFIEHLNYPEVLTGPVTGQVAYSIDLDDPGTLQGRGKFEVKDGQFSADFLYSILERQMEDEVATLPTSLKFSYLGTEVIFRNDVVETPVLRLDSEGVRVEGQGRYVRDGDMDYTLKVAISPDMAEQIPILRDSFSLQGLRLAQQDIELGFKIGGPTFHPRGQLAELPPASVTLVSGALEVTSEAIKVIDFPRKILVDLLKIGGGIVGATSR